MNETAVEFTNVSYTYPDGTPALRALSFRIRPGERVGLIGANGAGKSTLLKALPGLIEAPGVRVEGRDPLGREQRAVRQALGYGMQDPDDQLFLTTLWEDLTFGPLNYGLSREEADARAQEVLTALGITQLKDRRNQRLSGGEKRLAALAAVLTPRPSLLVLDEPSAALDPCSRRRLIAVLNSLSVTLLIAAHDLDLVLDTCDRVLLLDHGRLVADGPASELLRDRALLEAHGLELPLSLAPRL